MPDEPQTTPLENRPSRGTLAFLPSLIFIVGYVVLSKIGSVGLMGFDSYPLILSARIESWADFFGTFSESLMDGRYSGDYYRPLLNLSFALDYQLWGLGPRGYQFTGALLFGATGFGVAYLMTRLLEGRVGLGVVVAMLFFFLHDSHFEVVPVPARRPELLCGFFACIALGSQLLPKNLNRRWPVAPAVWMLLAAASKETGYALPAISVLVVFLYSSAGTAKERGLQALRAGAVHALLIGGLLLARVAVLGDLGGPAPLPEGLKGPNSIQLSGLLFERLFIPQNVIGWGLVVPVLAGIAGLGVLLCLRVGPVRKAGLVACAWMVVVGLLYGVSRSIEQWYLFLPVVGLSLLVGAGAQAFLVMLRRRRQPQALLAGLGALALAGFCFCQVRYSPLWHPYAEWSQATTASNEFFEKLERRVGRNAPGSAIKAPPLPIWVPAVQSGPAIRGAAILEDYSVQAWLELRHPDRQFRVLKGPPQSPLLPDESAVQLLRPYEFQSVSGL